MSQDNLSGEQFRLFHGTNKPKLRGGVVNPSKQRGDEWDGNGPHAAFASSKLEDAATYGKHVFEVHPQDYMENYGSGVFASESGFKVKRKMNPEVVDRYSRIFGPKREAQEQLAHRKFMGAHNMESWSHEGEKIYHLRYDKEGNEYKTQVFKMFGRPGQ